MTFFDQTRKVTALCFIVIVSLLIPKIEAAQNQRPIIGVALSGGGSLGLAHIGVLRYLEAHHVPVDRIVGTSMGGLLGGLYATGHDAKDLERIVHESDWSDYLRTTPKFEDRPIPEKQEWNRVSGVFAIPLGKGFALPAGINSGQALVGMLSNETAAYWDVQDFDNLPIPFRCVATDLTSGEAVILREGHLPQALRATMSIPGVFAPVQWKGRILVDGGLVNNFPADVAKQIGADVVIGVTLSLTPPSAQELQSLTNVVRQTVNIAVNQNELDRISLTDIHIAVQSGTRNSMDFKDTSRIIESGYKAASAHQAALEKYSLTNEAWEQHLRSRKARERAMPPDGPLGTVFAEHADLRAKATEELSRKSGPAITKEELRATLGGLMAATSLPNAFHGWHQGATKVGYDVEIETRRVTEVLMRPSVFYQFSNHEPSRPTLKITASRISKDAYKARLLGALYLGANPALFAEYYHPFGGSPFFVAPGIALQRNHRSQYSGTSRSDQQQDRFAASLDFGIGTWRHLQLRAGATAGLDRYSTSVTTNGVETSDTGFFTPRITGIINTQDSGRLPTSGLRVTAEAGWTFRENPFPYVQMNFDHFHPMTRHLSLFAVGQTESSLGRKLGFYDQFVSGGFGQLDAYRYEEVRGDTVLMAGGGFLVRRLNLENAAFRPIPGAWYQAASVDPWTGRSETKQSATVGILAPTPLGILGVTFSADLRGSTRWRVSLGSFWNRP